MGQLISGTSAEGSATVGELSTPQLPGRVGHFELTSFLGRGGMGEVYKARDTRLDRTVALKLLLPGPESLEQRFQREACAQAKIQHEAVCSVFEVGVAEGRSFIAMQYLEGQSLGDAADELTLEEKVLVIRQVAEAIDAAHTQALVHRDLKPGNIMVHRVDGTLRAWVLDFGMVLAIGDGKLTTTGEVLGSPCYMAPEQIGGEISAIDRRTDVYGLGAVCYEILAGRPPFEGKNVLEVLRQVAADEPAPLRRLRPELPEDLEWIVLRCLEKEPGRRYRSALALIEDLDRFRRGEPVLARRTTWRYRWSKRLRRHWRPLAAAALLLMMVGALAWRDIAQRRAASETARLTSHFLREKKELEWRLRAISMLPLHDSRAERDRMMGWLERLKQEVELTGEIGKGPGYFALGRGYQVLGAREKGLRYLERSWAQGFRDPRLSFSLGLEYSQLYDESLARLTLQPIPERQHALRREAEERYRAPAIARLREAGEGRREDSEWVAARIAAHEQRWTDALDALERVEENSPWFYETLGLRGLILHRQALAHADGEPTGAHDLLEQAEAALRSAIRIGASDPALYIKLCYQRDTRIAIFKEPIPAAPEARRRLLEPCVNAIRADSGSARAHAMAAQAAGSLGEALMRQEADSESVVFLEESARLAERALELLPNKVRALEELAEANYHLAALADAPERRDVAFERAFEAAHQLKKLEPLAGTPLFFEIVNARAALSRRSDSS
ncbi:MAG: protein kinase [Acidobacteriota bacterium]